MGRQTVSLPDRNEGALSSPTLVLLALTILLSSCAPLVLSPEDRAAITAGNKSLVLVRVLCTVDGKPFDPCIFRGKDPLLSDRKFVGFAAGSFETFGEPGYVKVQALSDESFERGWAFFLLSPGIYYLHVRGPDSSESSHAGSVDYYSRRFKEAPCWRIDVPEGEKLVYAGTLTLRGTQTGTLLLGDKIIVPAKNLPVDLSDERQAADSLLAGYFPGREVRSMLMQAWKPGDPYIFRRPLPGDTKQAGQR